jgi:hypothetical protein
VFPSAQSQKVLERKVQIAVSLLLPPGSCTSHCSLLIEVGLLKSVFAELIFLGGGLLKEGEPECNAI